MINSFRMRRLVVLLVVSTINGAAAISGATVFSKSNTFLPVQKGRVELRAGDSVKPIAAGNQDTGGQGRAGCTPAG